jgi:hypothetical protein
MKPREHWNERIWIKKIDGVIDDLQRDLRAVCKATLDYLITGTAVERAALVEALDKVSDSNSIQGDDA